MGSKILGISTLIGLGVLSAGCVSTEQSGVITGADFSSSIVGRDIAFQTGAAGQFQGTIRYNADGTATIRNANIPSISSDAGQWRLSGDEVCVTWTRIRSGTENCITWTRTGPNTYRGSDGSTIRVT